MRPADLLDPISAQNPAGDDAATSAELARIIQLRAAQVHGGLGATSETTAMDWEEISTATATLLREVSKDLRVACWWSEAQVAIAGLDGLCRGLELLNGLVGKFWDCGLHPSDDMDLRAELFDWLDKKVERSLPGTVLKKSDWGSLTWGDALGLQGQIDSVKNAEKARLAWQVEPAACVHHAERAAVAMKLVRDLKAALTEQHTHVTFDRTLPLLAAIERFATERSGTSEPASDPETQPEEYRSEPQLAEAPKAVDPWSECIAILRTGRFSDAETWMIRAFQADSSPREIFLRKLEIASVFLEQEHLSLARGILIGLMQQVETLGLERWESPELLARMWSLLYRSCSQAEDRTLREKAYDALCRTAPWAALNVRE